MGIILPSVNSNVSSGFLSDKTLLKYLLAVIEVVKMIVAANASYNVTVEKIRLTHRPNYANTPEIRLIKPTEKKELEKTCESTSMAYKSKHSASGEFECKLGTIAKKDEDAAPNGERETIRNPKFSRSKH